MGRDVLSPSERIRSPDSELRNGWSSDELQPRHGTYCGERTLFPLTLDELEVATNVSTDEMRHWHDRGWLSFDPVAAIRIDWGEEKEVRFVRTVIHSGLSDAWVNRLLNRLPEPYCYDIETTFYSFATGDWITLPEKPEIPDQIDEQIDELVREGEWEELQSIRDQIDELISGQFEEEPGNP